MGKLPARLLLLNLFRWIREYIITWGVLSFIYSLTVTLILQPFLERFFGREILFAPLWGVTCALLIIPAFLEALKLPPLGLVKRGGFSERFWRRPAGSLGVLYLRHDLRRGTTWFVVFLAVLIGISLPAGLAPLLVLVALIPVQRALYSVHKWRTLALAGSPRSGAGQLIRAIEVSQLVQALVFWLALGAASALPVETGERLSLSHWLQLGPAVLGGVLASASTAMEGDSGRPWMVNFIALAAGILGGFLCLYSPWFLLVVIYFDGQMRKLSEQRLHSVEHIDEDIIIS